jgi:hypothetical protein
VSCRWQCWSEAFSPSRTSPGRSWAQTSGTYRTRPTGTSGTGTSTGMLQYLCSPIFFYFFFPIDLKFYSATILLKHKVHKYKEYHSVCPLVGIRTLPPPLSPSECAPPLGTNGVRGWGSPNFRRLEKSLASAYSVS